MKHPGSIHDTVVRLATVAAVLMGAVACGNDALSASNSPSSDVLQFTATLAGGDEFDGNSLTGRPAVLWFWAPT